MKRPYVWVVEMKNGRKWEPCAEAALTLADARRQMRDHWQDNLPHDVFRVVKYVRPK